MLVPHALPVPHANLVFMIRCPLVQYITGLSYYIIILEIPIVLAYYGCDDASTAVRCCSLSVLHYDEVTNVNTVCPPAWLGLENKQEA